MAVEAVGPMEVSELVMYTVTGVAADVVPGVHVALQGEVLL